MTALVRAASGEPSARVSSAATMSPRPRTSPTPGCRDWIARRPSISWWPRAAERVDELLVEDHVDRRERGRATHRVRAVGPAVRASAPARHELGAGADRRDREARRDALRHDHDVGLDARVLDREHAPGAGESGLHLVGDEQDPVLGADLVRRPARTRAARGGSRLRRAPAPSRTRRSRSARSASGAGAGGRRARVRPRSLRRPPTRTDAGTTWRRCRRAAVGSRRVRRPSMSSSPS